ncbi:S-adenosyl-L-methionine-dependent methyltransferase [Leptodontidium sp. MPI-SDFR-AT-0119]|nr:S-adenosyl-L-methionine-dependent methyltransferase [Leptodontidium sp. MPI-SDFR-AT-0119]
MSTKSDLNGPSRLIDHFNGSSVQNQGSRWCALWQSNESDLWDRGKPSPPLIELVEQRGDIIQSRADNGRRKKALVPGCGRGYDVVMLAQHGFDAYGLEISTDAIAAAEAYSTSEMDAPSAYNFARAGRDSPGTAGGVTFLQGDFFQRDWELATPLEGDAKFDLIYDYTFLCALLPETRKSWATRMGDLLKPDGLLICLEFPLYKDPKLPGPPWGLKGIHWDLLARGGSGLLDHGVLEEESSTSLEGQFLRVLHIKPGVSYENGKGTDMLSVWGKKS